MGCLFYGLITVYIGLYICVKLGIEGDSGGALFIILLCVFGPIIVSAIKSSADEAEKKRLEEDRLREAARIEEEKRREVARIERVNSELAATIAEFLPKEDIQIKQATLLNEDSKYLNMEVIDAVHRNKQRSQSSFTKYSALNQQIKQILVCAGCYSQDDKLTHLQNHIEELKHLKRESDHYYQELETWKLQLLHENSEAMLSLQRAMQALLTSNKCVSNTITLKDFLPKDNPQDLMLFQYEYEPVTLTIDNFVFCLFSNVILVFDQNGTFSSALDPVALNVKVIRKKAGSRYSGTVDSDSKAITYTESRTRWLYSCKDGTPDLRYNGNRLIEYKVDVSGFEYGTILIAIGNRSVEFSVSSSHALDLFEHIPSVYCHTYKHIHNPIPNLLEMLDFVSEDKTVVTQISSVYLNASHNENYFCKEITT